MKFSLILCTVDRHDEVKAFLKSIMAQTYKNFEVIIVDQNPPDYLEKVIQEYREHFKIKRAYSERGLSKARNVGLNFCDPDTSVVCFPDDDCEYFPDTLAKAAKVLSGDRYSVVIGHSVDRDKQPSCVRAFVDNKEVHIPEIIKYAISYTIFIRFKKLVDVSFDEKLGVGSSYGLGSGEETDCLLGLYPKNYKFIYKKNVMVYHPNKTSWTESPERAFAYGRGFGYILKKNKVNRFYVGNILIRPLIGSLYSFLIFDKQRAKFYLNSFRGRLEGWLLNVS